MDSAANEGDPSHLFHAGLVLAWLQLALLRVSLSVNDVWLPEINVLTERLRTWQCQWGRPSAFLPQTVFIRSMRDHQCSNYNLANLVFILLLEQYFLPQKGRDSRIPLHTGLPFVVESGVLHAPLNSSLTSVYLKRDESIFNYKLQWICSKRALCLLTTMDLLRPNSYLYWPQHTASWTIWKPWNDWPRLQVFATSSVPSGQLLCSRQERPKSPHCQNCGRLTEKQTNYSTTFQRQQPRQGGPCWRWCWGAPPLWKAWLPRKH